MTNEMIKMFIAEKEKEYGKKVIADKAGTLILFHTVDRMVVGSVNYNNWVEAHK